MAQKPINHSFNRAESFLSLYETKKWADIILMIAGEEFRVHRLILRLHSPFFAKYLQNTAEDFFKLDCDASTLILDMIFRYIYSGKLNLDNVALTDLVEYVHLAHHFELDLLTKDLIEACGSKMNLENYKNFIRLAKSWGSKVLLEKCWLFADEEAAKFLETDEFQMLSCHEIIDLLSRKSFKSLTLERFKAIKEWVSRLPKPWKSEVLQCVDLKEFSDTELTEIVMPTGLFQLEDVFNTIADRKRETMKVEVQTGPKLINDTLFKWANLEESLPETLPNLARNGTVLLAKHKEFAFTRGTNFAESAETPSGYQFMIDLGETKTFNNIKFVQKMFEWCDFYISTSTGDSNWTKYCRYPVSTDVQDYYFPGSVTARYIKISGKICCNDIQVYLTSTPPDLVNGYVQPRGNIMSPETAIVHGVPKSDFLHGTVKPKRCGFGNAATEVRGRGVLQVLLKQPYYLTRVLIYPWQRNAKQSYRVVAELVEGQTLGSWECKDMSGICSFDLKGVVVGIKISSTNGRPLKLCHIEAFGY